MQETKSLCQMVDQDLEHCQTVWQDYSHDGEALTALFFLLLQHYHDVIDGFDEGLCVIQDKEPSAEMAEICRRNIKIMTERLFAFRENGYSNEGLMEYYIRKEQHEIDFHANFTTVRIELGFLELPAKELEEIMQKLNEMEAICAKTVPRSRKWEALREYLVWLSGKTVDVSMLILPLFFRINDEMIKRNET